MIRKNRHIVLVPKSRPKGLYSLEEIAERCHVHIAFVEKLFRMGIIDPYPHSARFFSPAVTVRVRKVMRLQEDLGINPEGAAVILDLIDKIDTRENKIRMLTGR